MHVTTALPRTRLLTALAIGGLLLTSCATPPKTTVPNSTSPLTVEQPWAKAHTTQGMTAVFATLVNESTEPVVLTGATAPGVASMVELHETVADPATGATVMQKMTEPITIGPGAAYILEPGADHIMLIDLQCGLYAGDDTEIVLSFADESTQTITTPIRDYAGAQEEYAPGEDETPAHSGDEEHAVDGHSSASTAEQGSCHE